ncbi:MAG: NAD(+) synthase [Pseudomonadota bacterium]
MSSKLHPNLAIDLDAEIERIAQWMRQSLGRQLRKRGCVIAMSGGIDSAVTAGLCVKAIGPDRVFGLMLPEQDSSSNSTQRGKELMRSLGIQAIEQNISESLSALGCYKARDAAIQSVFPTYKPDSWKNKIRITGGLQGQFNRFELVVEDPKGAQFTEELPLEAYLTIVAATNYKQRLRKSIEYFHADRLNYAVMGTPNRLEYKLGFFVKNGDGSADLKPIAHLYKSQVYAMAPKVGVPESICNATPTTDTYSLEQGQDEFYFALPYAQMDVAMWCYEKQRSANELAKLISISPEQAEFVLTDIRRKIETTAPLHWAGLHLLNTES